MELGKALARSIYDEGVSVSDATSRTEIARHAKTSAQAPRLEAMLELASTEPELVTESAALDSHRGLLGAQNGTLDLGSGKLRPAAREDYITKLAPTTFDANAACPQFCDFLRKIMGGNTQLVDYLQRVIGSLLSG
jgi:putative DNA primase/helicase